MQKRHSHVTHSSCVLRLAQLVLLGPDDSWEYRQQAVLQCAIRTLFYTSVNLIWVIIKEFLITESLYLKAVLKCAIRSLFHLSVTFIPVITEELLVTESLQLVRKAYYCCSSEHRVMTMQPKNPLEEMAHSSFQRTDSWQLANRRRQWRVVQWLPALNRRLYEVNASMGERSCHPLHYNQCNNRLVITRVFFVLFSGTFLQENHQMIMNADRQ
jgi:hypothetical protein